ncbi:hypothetical protein INT80_12180 [Gallibacterium anatis]|uniref:Uncharacterized protein n=1 Tax=Gallibacterium anatis TaxID=750 RepID=A0A930UWR6_9PAST|nr:hypothetical protein [Gallibacterium anatis]
MLIGLSVNTLQQAQQHNAFNGVIIMAGGPIFQLFPKRMPRQMGSTSNFCGARHQ